MSTDQAYATYWRRKELLAGPLPRFPVLRWWPEEGPSEAERAFFDAVLRAGRVLDFGAGDLRIARKFERAGFAGEYHTLDIGGERAYTYRDLSEVDGAYDAILCLDVLEHMPLEAGLSLLRALAERLSPGGALVVQTPNARCVRSPYAWDMTHVHCYNLPDLWAYLTCLGLATDGYRVVLRPRPRRRPGEALRDAIAAFFATRIVGGDYADNILAIARSPAP